MDWEELGFELEWRLLWFESRRHWEGEGRKSSANFSCFEN